ncbi:MAG: ribose-5-phosphate isomerase RpiA [Spirochaetales bacterium]|nr:ribose-5-phosphate isomerase RpiA [Spirochaetales bacterium]MCF7939174.1 ribose-5-phosphate isomerase RpiA [Spirochaetales bacterium]
MSLDTTAVKELVGQHAVDELVRSGMKVGLGTGSTAVWAVRRLGRLLQEGSLRDILAVATSSQTEMECQKLGIPLRNMNDPEIDGRIDVVIDGADEVDPQLNLTKGGGGALLREKVVAYAAGRVGIITDPSKIADRLGLNFPVPVEVVPMARLPVTRSLEAIGGKPEVRMAQRKMGAVITDNGNILLDVTFPEPFDPPLMERRINEIPGVVENGLFCGIEPVVYVGKESGEVETRTAR